MSAYSYIYIVCMCVCVRRNFERVYSYICIVCVRGGNGYKGVHIYIYGSSSGASKNRFSGAGVDDSILR